MTFSIHQLDRYEYGSEEAETAFSEYIDTLIEQFCDSPEGSARREQDPGLGSWASRLVDFGYNHLGTPPPSMTVEDVDEIVNELFPNKISLASPDDADEAIPELIAFWRYLKREYQLANADAILAFLHDTAPEFRSRMNDPANFGMAKSFVMAGQQAGFDMSTDEGLRAFQQQYDASLSQQIQDSDGDLAQLGGFPGFPHEGDSTPGSKVNRAKRKQLRKQAKAARKKNRKRKK